VLDLEAHSQTWHDRQTISHHGGVMPGGPDYPMDSSPRYPKDGLADLIPPRAKETVQGVFETPEGDIRTWVIASEVTAARRDLYVALAYLDVADRAADARNTLMVVQISNLGTRIDDIAHNVGLLQAGLQEQQATLAQISSLLGVVVPAWQTLTQVQNGDDMGLVRPSAAQLGLTADIIPVQQEPGFGQEDVVSIDPPPGTLVARGSTVHLQVNYQG
jgi:hypothetical protein